MKKIKLRTLVISIALILSTYFSQETLAYYTAGGVATNVVTSGGVKLQIHEETADGTAFPEDGIYVEPGDVVSKRVSVENISTQPFYLRVILISGVEQSAMSGDDVFDIDLNTADWTRQEDGYIITIVSFSPVSAPLPCSPRWALRDRRSSGARP